MAITNSGYYGLVMANMKSPTFIFDGWEDAMHIFHKRDWNSSPQYGRAIKFQRWKLFEHGLTDGNEVRVRRAVQK